MPAKKTIYVASTATTRTIKRNDVERLKRALQKMFTEYRNMKAQQRRFELALGEVCAITTRWSIPRRELGELKKFLG